VPLEYTIEIKKTFRKLRFSEYAPEFGTQSDKNILKGYL